MTKSKDHETPRGKRYNVIFMNDDDDDLGCDALVKVAELMENGQMVSETRKPQLCFHQQFNLCCSLCNCLKILN